MYFPKLLYEEFKKLRKEKKTISKHLNKIDPEHFLFIKHEFFSVSNFEKLDSTKKVLFSDEIDFENKKFIFEELNDFRNLRKFFLVNLILFSAKRLFVGKANLTSSLNYSFFKEKILSSPKKILTKSFLFTIFFFAALHYEKKFFEMEIANKITIESRLGIFLWFESNYRNGLINTNTINFLDEHIQRQFNLVNMELKSELNEALMHNMVFYALTKQHFYDIFISKTLQNIIIPLLNFQEKSNENAAEAKIQKFLFGILRRNFEKIKKERFYSFDSVLNEERNLKANKGLDYVKALFKGSFRDELNGVDIENNNEDKKEKLFLNENLLGNLFRIEELQQIYLNDFFEDKLKDFYEDYRNGNI